MECCTRCQKHNGPLNDVTQDGRKKSLCNNAFILYYANRPNWPCESGRGRGAGSATRGHLIERPNQRGIVKSKQQQLLYKRLGSVTFLHSLILPTTLCNIRLEMIVKGTVGYKYTMIYNSDGQNFGPPINHGFVSDLFFTKSRK